MRRYADELQAEAERWGVDLGEPTFDDDAWEARSPSSRRSGCRWCRSPSAFPVPDMVAALHAANTTVLVTVTTPQEALAARDVGADVLVVQGIEAGGHRGGFADEDGAGEYGVLTLLRLVARAVDLPLVAAGGPVDSPAGAAVLVARAEASQLGTAFLRCPEAGTSPAHRQALTAYQDTALTRAFSGRRARGLVNQFLAEHTTTAPAAYPQVHHLTTPCAPPPGRSGIRTRSTCGPDRATPWSRPCPPGSWSSVSRRTHTRHWPAEEDDW